MKPFSRFHLRGYAIIFPLIGAFLCQHRRIRALEIQSFILRVLCAFVVQIFFFSWRTWRLGGSKFVMWRNARYFATFRRQFLREEFATLQGKTRQIRRHPNF